MTFFFGFSISRGEGGGGGAGPLGPPWTRACSMCPRSIRSQHQTSQSVRDQDTTAVHNFFPTTWINDEVVQVNCKIYLPVRSARHYNSISWWPTHACGWYKDLTIRSWRHYYSTNNAG